MPHSPTSRRHYSQSRLTNLRCEIIHAKKAHRSNGSQVNLVLKPLPPRTYCRGDLVGVVGERNIRLCRETNPSHPSFTPITSSHSAASLYVNNHNHHYRSTSAGRYVYAAKTIHQEEDSCDKWKARFIMWRQRDGTVNAVLITLDI